MPGREDQGGVGVAERTTAARDRLTAAAAAAAAAATAKKATATDPKGDPDARRQAQLDADFTARVIASTGPNAAPRLAQIMPSLIRHLHAFAREVDLTVAEWAAGVKVINEAGHMSDDKRNETQLLCNVLGLEALVDEQTWRQLRRPGSTATPSAVLGPFYRAAAPTLPLGASIVQAFPAPAAPAPAPASAPASSWYAEVRALRTCVVGRVLSAGAGAGAASSLRRPIAGAAVEVWEAAPNGLYEQQDPDQPDMNLRGRFLTDADGRYAFECLRPTPYPIPADGPAGRLLQALDRHAYRPAHIHFIVTAPGFRPLVTQIFDDEDPNVDCDSVFAVKPELLVHFRERRGGGGGGGDEADGPRYDLEYDFSLVEQEEEKEEKNWTPS